jgi:sec-independent protein translocase protein TatB
MIAMNPTIRMEQYSTSSAFSELLDSVLFVTVDGGQVSLARVGKRSRLGKAGTAITFMMAMGITPTIQVASIGIPDTLFLMLLALVVFGPRRLPEIGRQIGKLMYEFRKVSNDFKFQMEEELRASEEADRLRKLQATSQVTLDVPPQPVSEVTPEPALELGAGETVVEPSYSSGPPEDGFATEKTDAAGEVAPAVAGEVRGEPRKFPPMIAPPTSGEVIAAQKPFRGRVPEEEAGAETVTESGAEANHVAETPVVVADEGRVGTEVQPGVEAERGVTAGSERDVSHA